MFDFNRDGKLDSFERAVELEFLEEFGGDTEDTETIFKRIVIRGKIGISRFFL